MADREGFEAFVAARRDSLLRLGWLLTGDWHAAEDLVQTALVRCYPRWGRIAATQPEAYVRRVMVSVQASWWRRRWRGEVPAATVPELPAQTDATAVVDLQRLLVAALAELPARQRLAVVLRHYQDLSEAETAALLDCSVGAVKSQTAKGLARLRRGGLLLTADTEGVADVTS